MCKNKQNCNIITSYTTLSLYNHIHICVRVQIYLSYIHASCFIAKRTLTSILNYIITTIALNNRHYTTKHL